MVEVTGAEIRKLTINKNIDFEWDIMPYPDLTTDTTPMLTHRVRGVTE